MTPRWKPITWNEECNVCGCAGTRYARVTLNTFGWKPRTGEASQGGAYKQVIVSCNCPDHATQAVNRVKAG